MVVSCRVVSCRVVSCRVVMVWSDGVCCVAGCVSVARCERKRHVTSTTVPKTEICESTKKNLAVIVLQYDSGYFFLKKNRNMIITD